MQTSFDPYVIEEMVSEGSVATVWRAMQPELGRRVAIKALTPRFCADPSALVLFRGEARRLTELANPHIVAVYDFVDDAPPPYLVTEWIDGVSLRAMVESAGTLSPEQSLGVLRGALMGLDYAHQRQVVHGDVSPSNMVIDRSGTTKLIDFGLAAPAGEPGVSGTPAYLSPEAAAGRPLLPSSDVYSAAAVLFQLLAGHPVFSGPDAISVIRAQRDEVAPALTQHGPQVEQLLSRALSKDPVERPADAGEFLAQLETVAEERFGAGWLTKASVASLVGAAGVAGTAAVAASTVAAGGAASTTATASSSAVAGEALATSAAADTGAALPAAHAAAKAGVAVGKTAGKGGRLMHALTVHPVVTGAVAVVAVAAVTTTAVVVATSSPKPKPTPQAILVASAPQGEFVATGAIASSSDKAVKPGKLGSFPWKITQKCGPKSCTSTVTAPGTKYPFVFDGKAFTSTDKSVRRATCVDRKTKKEVPGSTALRTQTVTWTLTVTKRAPADGDLPGRPLALRGTATDNVFYSAPLGGCEITPSDNYTTRYSYTLAAK